MMQIIFFEAYVRPILSVIVIIVLAYILYRFRATKNPKEDSLDIMKKRLEQGKITREDYERAKKRQGKK